MPRSRWWLAGIGQVVPWLEGRSLPTISRLLRRLNIRYKRGRRYVHSPDLAYAAKLDLIDWVRGWVAADPQQRVMVYQDELSYYRRPSLAQGYGVEGSDGPRADQGHRANSRRRIAACLDVTTGRLVAWQRARFDRHTLIDYFMALKAAYPQAQHLFVVLDNWPVHFHPDVLEALRETGVILVRLPTYAPWTNPVEKVWRKLYQEVLHLHDFVDDWDGLKQAVADWLDQFTGAAPDLLRYIGLYPD